MAYDEVLADRIRALLEVQAPAEKAMFGGLAFLIGGTMTVAVGEGGLMVRIPPERSAELHRQPGAGEVTMGNRRPMKGWLRVDAEAVHDDATLAFWVGLGVERAKTLPGKAGPQVLREVPPLSF